MEQNDESLMLRMKEGDYTVFAVLVNRYKQSVVNLIAHILGDNIDAEDIAQQVFIQVYRHAVNYEVRSKFTTWLFTIARNLSLNEIRRRKRHPADSMDEDQKGEEGEFTHQYEDKKMVSPDVALQNQEVMKQLKRVLAELPEKQRTALLLFQEQGLSYEEISQVLEISLSSTKSLIFRARDTLKRELRNYLSL